MATCFTFYAWELSWYSGKIRPYLRYKGIPYTEVAPDLLTFYRTMPKRCGASGVPVVVTPEGEWINDSSCIIERMEARLPAPSVIPFAPRQRFVSSLLEMWFDEFWLPTGVYTRWGFPEHYPKWEREIGSNFAPCLPRFLQNRVAAIPKKYMEQVNRDVGATPEQIPLIERWTVTHLDALDAHFAQYPYLLGDRPCVADFALSGPVWGHFLFDERSLRELLEPRKNLHAWVKRLDKPAAPGADFLGGDQIPETLTLALRSVFEEMLPYLKGCLRDVHQFIAAQSSEERIPRFGPLVSHPFADGQYNRVTLPYTLWMAQRTLDTLSNMAPADAAKVREWIIAAGGAEFLSLNIPRMRRVGYQVALEVCS